jgi:hypothetical protein
MLWGSGESGVLHWPIQNITANITVNVFTEGKYAAQVFDYMSTVRVNKTALDKRLLDNGTYCTAKMNFKCVIV